MIYRMLVCVADWLLARLESTTPMLPTMSKEEVEKQQVEDGLDPYYVPVPDYYGIDHENYRLGQRFQNWMDGKRELVSFNRKRRLYHQTLRKHAKLGTFEQPSDPPMPKAISTGRCKPDFCLKCLPSPADTATVAEAKCQTCTDCPNPKG